MLLDALRNLVDNPYNTGAQIMACKLIAEMEDTVYPINLYDELIEAVDACLTIIEFGGNEIINDLVKNQLREVLTKAKGEQK